MISIKQFSYFFIFIAFIGLTIPQTYAQETNEADKIKVDELSDDQVQTLLDRAYAAGLSKAEFLKALELQGMPLSEVAKMRERINESGSETVRSSKLSKRDAREQVDFDEIALGMFQLSDVSPKKPDGDEIFGSSLFYQRNRRLSFEPSMNQATPKSYILGSGDLIYVDIYGNQSSITKPQSTRMVLYFWIILAQFQFPENQLRKPQEYLKIELANIIPAFWEAIPIPFFK